MDAALNLNLPNYASAILTMSELVEMLSHEAPARRSA